MMKINKTFLLCEDCIRNGNLLVQAEGTAAEKATHLSLGGVDLSIGSSPTDYGYTGQMREGDIYYYGARWPKVPEAQPWDLTVPIRASCRQTQTSKQLPALDA